MDDFLNIHDLFHAGTIAAAVAVLWFQSKAIQRWAERHEKRDDERFDQHQERLNELSDRVGGGR